MEDAGGPRFAPLVLPQLGIDHIRRMGFVYGDGWPLYDKAVAAVRAGDADAAQRHAEASISKDPYHLDAHFLLARLLARAGDHAAAVDHLVIALAADYYAYAAKLADEADLTEFRATPHGQAVSALATKIRDGYGARVSGALWLVARRSRYKWPKERGTQYSTSRGEVYAYDRSTKRFFRLTHTGHKVLAFVRAERGAEVAVIGFDKIDRPRVAGDGAEPPAGLAAAWLQRYEATTWQPIGAKIALPATRALEVGYAPGGGLVVATAEETTTGYAVSGDKLGALDGPLPAARIVFSIDEGASVRPATAITATWTGDPPAAPSLKLAGGATIAIPESGAAAQATVAIAPDGARVVFATAVDPCNQDTAPSLYVADARTGTLRHVLTARSRFSPRWLDDARVAYEDGEGAIRIWDASTGRQAYKLDNPPGIGLDALSLAPARRCVDTEDPSAAAGGDDPDEPPMPPEEPITMPR